MSGIAANFSGGHDNSGFINLLAGLGAASLAPKNDGGGAAAGAAPAQTSAPVGNITNNAGALAAPATNAAGDAIAGAPGSRPAATSMTPSFLSAAALPNYAPPQQQDTNRGGKTLLGQ